MSVDFLDSNVVLYLVDEVDDRKRAIAETVVARALERRNAQISFQVVQEVLRAMTTKFRRPAAPPEALRFFDRVLSPLWQVMPSAELYRRRLDVQSRYRFSFYDSLIVAAALTAGCTRLLSEDLQHGQRIENLTIENPFR